jgi:hypothetical protein
MTWKAIRLELARTADFPQGSEADAYVLRLPIDDIGFINRSAMNHTVESQIVHRMWPGEPDRTRVVIARWADWACLYGNSHMDDEGIFRLEHHPIKPGEYLTMTETAGRHLPFKVVRCNG